MPVTSHVSTSHVTHMKKSRHTHERAKLNHIVSYGVATVSRIDKIMGLFRRISSLLKVSFAKETYNFIDPTNQLIIILQLSDDEMSDVSITGRFNTCAYPLKQTYITP